MEFLHCISYIFPCIFLRPSAAARRCYSAVHDTRHHPDFRFGGGVLATPVTGNVFLRPRLASGGPVGRSRCSKGSCRPNDEELERASRRLHTFSFTPPSRTESFICTRFTTPTTFLLFLSLDDLRERDALTVPCRTHWVGVGCLSLMTRVKGMAES
ncbi:hypothetical protein EDD17DRAFT_300063 [Pisolithus thermaeus]|nr:hypothetical protein EV401DRAFT_404382 [Pisolithus croceorrhizus]KAI6140779.1 hypothetical protein EDD17DRAFT_300063 [Pisolithus thermaeus]